MDYNYADLMRIGANAVGGRKVNGMKWADQDGVSTHERDRVYAVCSLGAVKLADEDAYQAMPASLIDFMLDLNDDTDANFDVMSCLVRKFQAALEKRMAK